VARIVHNVRVARWPVGVGDPPRRRAATHRTHRAERAGPAPAHMILPALVEVCGNDPVSPKANERDTALYLMPERARASR